MRYSFTAAALKILASFLIFITAAGCANQEIDLNTDEHNEGNQINDRSGGNESINRTGLSSAPEEGKFDIADLDESVADAQTTFSLNVYHAVRKLAETKGEPADENLFISPFSIAAALAMTANGAEEETLEEMKAALQMPDLSMDEVNKGYQVLIDLLTHSGEEVKLTIANSLWAKEGLHFHDAFIEANQSYYNAEITALDFQSQQAAERINAWVNQQTNGKIPNIIDGPIDQDTILFLINAIYFDANWAKPFREEQTKEKPFTLPDGTTKEVPMMVNFGDFQYFEGNHFEAVRLPYKGHRLSMLVFLPDEDSNLDEFTNQLSADNWRKWLASFERANGNLEMPKFQIEYETGLKNVLASLGMETAFLPHAAQFDQMISLPQNVYLKDVKHKAYIDVQEKGTVAAAVTSVEAGVTSAPAKTFQLNINRPFFLAIHDQRTDTILFMGTVTEP